MSKESISLEHIAQVFQAVYLGVTGKYDAEKYNFQTKAGFKVSHSWLSKFISTKYDARVFSAVCIYNGAYWYDLDEMNSYKLFKEWRTLISSPTLVADHSPVETLNDLSVWTRDGLTGPKILNDLLGGTLHFVTYSYIMRTTKAHAKWSSMNWKLQRNRIELLDKVIDIDTPLVIQYASKLKQRIAR